MAWNNDQHLYSECHVALGDWSIYSACIKCLLTLLSQGNVLKPLSSLQKHESIYFNDSCFHRHRRKYWTNSFQMNRTIWLQIEPTQTVSAGGWLCRRKEVTDSSFPVSWWNKKSWQRKTESCDITKTFSFQTPHGAWDPRHSAQLPSNGFKAPTFGSVSRKGVDFN